MEVMIIEFDGRNKNTPYLVAVAYQPSPYESDKLLWLENFETLLCEVTTKWDGITIITGDINVDLIGEQKESTKHYKNILHSFNLHQHITKPTKKSKSLIGHICSNVPNKLIYNDIIYTDEIGDDDTPFVILNIKKKRYEPRYKYIRDERKVDMNQYVNDFSKLPLSLVYGLEEPEDPISTLNKDFTDCLESHAPTGRVKLTRPIAPWMKDPTIVSDRQKLELPRIKSRDSENPKEHEKYLEDKKQYKKTIKDKKNSFLRKALSSKNPKTVWNAIDRILKIQQKE